ncbi:MAG: hypothetical protein IKI40_10590, partial [Treponema sp.]|nr:hypothetical protein [Treponema sp.]
AMNLHDRDITKRARQEGIQLKAVDDAKNLLAMNLGTHEQIAQAVDLPLEKVREIAEQLRIKNAERGIIN